MRCSEIQERVSALLDNRLEKADQAAVQRHLQECGECRRYYESLLLVHDRSKQALAYQPAQAYFDALPDRIMARIPAAPAARPWYRKRPRPVWVWRGLAYASVLGLLAGVTVVAYRTAENRELHKFTFGNSSETLGYDDRAPLQHNESKTETPVADEQKADKVREDIVPPKPVGGVDIAPAAAAMPEREKTSLAGNGPAHSAELARSSEQFKPADRLRESKASPSPKQVSAMALSKTAVSLQEADSYAVHSSAGSATQSLERSNSADDSRKLLTSYLQALQSAAGYTAEQRNKIILQAAVLFHCLAGTDTLRSLRQSALTFYEQHQKVLIDSLGEGTVHQQMREFGK
jgi:hypothetical protein